MQLFSVRKLSESLVNFELRIQTQKKDVDLEGPTRIRCTEELCSVVSDVRFCTSRVEAIKYLMQDETAKKGELTKMRKGLLADGWMTDHKLPKVGTRLPNFFGQ